MTTRAYFAVPSGYTLIELVVTVAIVGLLAGIALPTAELAVQRSREQDLKLALREIRGGLDAYKQAYEEGRIAKKLGESGYPPTLSALVEGVADAQSAQQRKLYFLRRIPRDPMVRDASVPAERTWGLRSYVSDADAPHEGADVFDVYSKADGTGLDGVPYRRW